MKLDAKMSTPNHVIVEVEQTYDDKVKYGSLELTIDHEFNPTQYARIYGKVVAVPQGKCLDEEGKEIVKEIEVGDRVYFHYLVTAEENFRIYGNYYKIPYYWIFASVRDERIIPIGSWTLCKPIIEEEFEKVDVGGVKIEAVVSKSGLVTSVVKKPSVRHCIVSYIGTPLVEEGELGIGNGSKVVLDVNSNFVNKVEGEDFYTVKQRYILVAN